MKSILLNSGFVCFRNLLVLAALAGGAWLSNPAAARADALTVPSYSFETPDASASPFAVPAYTYWEKNAQPTNYTNPEFPWDYTMGVFYNYPAPGSYIDNCDGVQGAYIYELPGAGIYQDYTSQDESQPSPTHAFNYLYNPTNAYTLTVAVLGYTGAGSPLSTNATITLSLYYRDASNNVVTLAATTVTNSAANFPVHTHFVDFQAQVPAVRTNDAWAGQNIGIALNASVTDFDSGATGGYWDVDNVRLVETPTPALQNLTLTNRQASFTLLSQPGLIYNIQTTTNVITAGSNWASLGTVTNTTGFLQYVDTNTVAGAKFYRARQTQ